MGCCHSSNTAQRVSLLVLAIVEKDLDAGLEGALATLDPAIASGIRRWRERRLEEFGGAVEQARPWHIGSYQDDSPIQTLKPLAAWVESVILSTLTRLRVHVAGKCLDVRFSEQFEAIGGAFDTAVGSKGCRVGPTRETMVKLRTALDELHKAADGADQSLGWHSFEALVGLLEWACRFLPDGVAGLVEMHRRMRVARRRARYRQRPAMLRGSAGPKVHAGKGLGAQLEDIWLALVNKDFRPWTQSPLFWHGGAKVSADASTADGWGVHAGGIFAARLWEPATKIAIGNSRKKRHNLERVSISPLELIAQVLLLVTVARTYVKPPGGQFVFRCDNSSVIDVLETRRPRSPAMRRALAWLVLVEKHFGLQLKLEHIASEDNLAADAFSHARIEAGRAELRKLGLVPAEFPMGKVAFEGWTLEEFALVMERDVRVALLESDLELA